MHFFWKIYQFFCTRRWSIESILILLVHKPQAAWAFNPLYWIFAIHSAHPYMYPCIFLVWSCERQQKIQNVLSKLLISQQNESLDLQTASAALHQGNISHWVCFSIKPIRISFSSKIGTSKMEIQDVIYKFVRTFFCQKWQRKVVNLGLLNLLLQTSMPFLFSWLDGTRKLIGNKLACITRCTANKVHAASGSQTEDYCMAEAEVESAGSY